MILGCIYDIAGLLALIPGALYAIDNWRAWYRNTFHAKEGGQAEYHPLIGTILLFWGFSILAPDGFELWPTCALLLDFGCVPLGLLKLWQLRRRSIASK